MSFLFAVPPSGGIRSVTRNLFRLKPVLRTVGSKKSQPRRPTQFLFVKPQEGYGGALCQRPKVLTTLSLRGLPTLPLTKLVFVG